MANRQRALLLACALLALLFALCDVAYVAAQDDGSSAPAGDADVSTTEGRLVIVVLFFVILFALCGLLGWMHSRNHAAAALAEEEMTVVVDLDEEDAGAVAASADPNVIEDKELHVADADADAMQAQKEREALAKLSKIGLGGGGGGGGGGGFAALVGKATAAEKKPKPEPTAAPAPAKVTPSTIELTEWATERRAACMAEFERLWRESGGAEDSPATRQWCTSTVDTVGDAEPAVAWRETVGLLDVDNDGTQRARHDHAGWQRTRRETVERLRKLVRAVLDSDTIAVAGSDTPMGLAAEIPVTKGAFDWGLCVPLEREIASNGTLAKLLGAPLLHHTALAIVEPAANVGKSPQTGEEVRASQNIAYTMQSCLDLDSQCFPLWRTGVANPAKLMQALTQSLAVVVEGGYFSTYVPESYPPACPRADMLELMAALFLARASNKSCASFFICVGHQLAAETHVLLIRRFVSQVRAMTVLNEDDEDNAELKKLQAAAERIHEVGSAITVVKSDDARTTVKGYTADGFAVLKNEAREMKVSRLLAYETAKSHPCVPDEVLAKHASTQRACSSTLERLMRFRDMDFTMFHGDEVNEEAILFANWAYAEIRTAIGADDYSNAPVVKMVRLNKALNWVLQLPCAVEILASTRINMNADTEAACTAIYYMPVGECLHDEATMAGAKQAPRHNTTLQFHPELSYEFSDVNHMDAVPDAAQMRADSGSVLLFSLLADSMESS